MSHRLGILFGAILILVLKAPDAFAQDDIPTTSGFSGYVLAGPGYFKVKSNRIVTGAPLLGDVGNTQIESIFDPPEPKGSAAFLVAGELNYTFGKSRTQLFLGNRLEDILRLDVAYGVGIRQELPDSSIMAVSLLFTPLELKFWEDPYVEGEDRIKTGLNFPGLRFRWGRILKTGLELTATWRRYSYDVEKSGDWLIGQSRLAPEQQSSLIRDGDVLRLQVLYRITLKRHRLEPAIRFLNDDHDGGAIANQGYALKLTYLYLTPKVVLDVNFGFGQRSSSELHPVYNEILETDRIGAAVTAFIPIRRSQKSVLNVFIGGELFEEDANIDFFDSSIGMVMAGILWRHLRQ